MKPTIWNKRIPTLLGIFFLLGSIGITSVFVKQGTALFSHASTDSEPLNIHTSNLSDTTATVSFTTNKESIATVSYGTTEQHIEQVATDVRDQASSPVARTVHVFSLNNLIPNTQYFLTITAGGTIYKQPDGKPFQLTTGPTLTFTSQIGTDISGKIVTATGEVGKDILVYITSDTAQEVSSISGIDGSFSLSLKTLRNKDFSQPLAIVETSHFSLLATDGQNQSHVLFTTKQASPLPIITLGNDYDFSLSQTPMQESTETSDIGHITFPETQSTADNPQIITPGKQAITTSVPVFTGTGKPNESVAITLRSTEVIQAKVITNYLGKWTYKPTTVLLPGAYTITIKTKDLKGSLKTISSSFTIIAKSQ